MKKYFMFFIILAIFIYIQPAMAREDLYHGLDNLTRQITNSMKEENKVSIAVIEFPDLDGKQTQLGKFISEELVTRLYQTERFKVIERQLLNKVMDEHEFNQNGFVDPDSVQELGKILGVDAIVTGTITDLGTSIKINSRLISTETGQIFAVGGSRIVKDSNINKLMGYSYQDSFGLDLNEYFKKINDLSHQFADCVDRNGKLSIAVVEFSDLYGKTDRLGKFTAEELVTRLYKTGRFNVIERQLINKVLNEYKLDMKGYVDPDSAQELGQILGVEAIATGTITELENGIKINSRIISTETGEIMGVASIDEIDYQSTNDLKSTEEKEEDSYDYDYGNSSSDPIDIYIGGGYKFFNTANISKYLQTVNNDPDYFTYDIRHDRDEDELDNILGGIVAGFKVNNLLTLEYAGFLSQKTYTLSEKDYRYSQDYNYSYDLTINDEYSFQWHSFSMNTKVPLNSVLSLTGGVGYHIMNLKYDYNATFDEYYRGSFQESYVDDIESVQKTISGFGSKLGLSAEINIGSIGIFADSNMHFLKLDDNLDDNGEPIIPENPMDLRTGLYIQF